MAEATVKEVEESNTTDMEVENTASDPNGADAVTVKRHREEDESKEDDEDGVSKKAKLEKSVEEERLENLEQQEQEQEEEEEEAKSSGPVNVGYKSFGSSVEMFDYFYKILHQWPLNLNVNKYEHVMLLELLKMGHPEPDKKIGAGIRSFQVQNHSVWKSKCFFLIREDDSMDDFSFRKCVDHIIPLPEEMQLKSHVNQMLGGGGKGRGGRGGRGGGRGHGKGGKFRR